MFLFFFFSDENKVDDTPKNEKESKNCENMDTRVADSEKDENSVSDSGKVKETDEYKDTEETADDKKSRTYIEYVSSHRAVSLA